MERIAFLIEDSGERIGGLLNPESLIIRRQAGVRARRSSGGLVTGADLADDQLLYCGGGNTELTMNLLFDVSLAGSSISTEDVRDLTGPFRRLAENSQQGGSYGNPPVCRFVWGKSWDIPGLVTAVAERLEYFTQAGVPRRSLMRLLFRRVMEPIVSRPAVTGPERPVPGRGPGLGGVGERLEAHEVTGGERPDQIAHSNYRDPALSRALMSYNDIDDPLHIPAGTILDIPP
ncbi:MAG: hypothetical protein GY859_41005, partial [Desulfobacterales bacterium]|nr:hypothetical protein [Desulfobacterales bacterium]